MTDLAALDAVGQAELVARGECKATELVEAAIDRIARVNPQINAVIHDRSEKARAEAEQATGPLAGVPFLVKDAVCHTAGDPYHLGMRALKDANWTEPNDTWLAERFRAAGFVFVGKTNTPELASSVRPNRWRTASRATRGTWTAALVDRAVARVPRSRPDWFLSRTATTWVVRSVARQAAAGLSV